MKCEELLETEDAAIKDHHDVQENQKDIYLYCLETDLYYNCYNIFSSFEWNIFEETSC